MREDVFPDFAEAFIAQFVDEVAEAVFGDVEILEVLVGVLDCLGLGVLRERKLLLTCLQDESTTARPLRLEVIHIPSLNRNNIYPQILP